MYMHAMVNKCVYPECVATSVDKKNHYNICRVQGVIPGSTISIPIPTIVPSLHILTLNCFYRNIIAELSNKVSLPYCISHFLSIPMVVLISMLTLNSFSYLILVCI